MKLFNTDIIDTVADDKKLLIQGWCFKKSLSTVPKREIYVFERCVNIIAACPIHCELMTSHQI